MSPGTGSPRGRGPSGRGRGRAQGRVGAGGRAGAGREAPTGRAARSSRSGGRAGGSPGDRRVGAGRSPTRAGLGGEQVEGRQAVRELLRADRRRVTTLLLAEGMDDAPILDEIESLAARRRVRVQRVSRRRLDAAARTDSAQGVVALAHPVRETALEELAASGPGGRPPFLLVVDGITDPHNLGAVLRSAECAGVTGVVLPRHRSTHLSPTVAKVAAGAVEYLPMALAAGVPSALRTLVGLGMWSVGLDADAPRSVYELPFGDQPVALVLGSEGTGLAALTRKRCDVLCSIPQYGALSSLNAATAGAIACFEVARQRGRTGG